VPSNCVCCLSHLCQAAMTLRSQFLLHCVDLSRRSDKLRSKWCLSARDSARAPASNSAAMLSRLLALPTIWTSSCCHPCHFLSCLFHSCWTFESSHCIWRAPLHSCGQPCESTLLSQQEVQQHLIKIRLSCFQMLSA